MKKSRLLAVGIIAVLCLVTILLVIGRNNKNEKNEIETITIELDGCNIKLNKIKAGSFKMGSYEGVGEEDELPVRDIEITKDFYIGVYEITQAQWEAVMGNNPSTFKNADYPVETITWNQANEFCEKLSEISGYKVSLPTEAQWEYACRAGSETKWFFGDDESKFSEYCEDDIDAKTREVGQFKPNGNGLYDMYGNVMEWCLDYYSPEYLKDDVTDPKGPAEGEAKVSRGGGWGGSPELCRSGYRNACGENDATDGIGFRIVVNP